MKIGIVGGGIAGLATARLLREHAEVVLFERDEWLGGHARTIDVDGVAAETGFKYMFESTHPNVLALIRSLGVPVRRQAASASVTLRDGRVVSLPPRGLRQALSLASDSIGLRGAAALARLNLVADRIIREADWSQDLETTLLGMFSRELVDAFLLPFFAASWGLRIETIARFPAYDVLKVMGKGARGFLEVEGGASRYIEALVRELRGVRLHTNEPVVAVRRVGSAVVLSTARREESFDRVVVATPGNHARSLLDGIPEWRGLLDGLRYEPTTIVLHRDPAFMPRRRDDWRILNCFVGEGTAFATEWCGYRERRDVFRTWLLPSSAPPRDVVHRQEFEHLVVTPASLDLQRALARNQGAAGVFVAGMYVNDVDIHESSLRAAMTIAERLVPIARSPRAGAAAAALEPSP